MQTSLSRRGFLGRSAAVAGGSMLSAAALERLVARGALASTAGHPQPYGPLARRADQRGVEVLALPPGFAYVTFSHAGTTMSDGNPTPLALDGMAAFRSGRPWLVQLVRNHEDRNLPGQGSVGGEPAAEYDAQGGGGTVTLLYDERRRRLLADYISLNGTIVNCAGGIGRRRRSWISGEESVGGPAAAAEAERFPERHGYLFEVPLRRGPGAHERIEPIRAAGRFSHEAVAVGRRSGIVYETEDPGSGRGAGFYRYVPDDPRDLHAGGRLQMLRVADAPQQDMREGQRMGRPLWVDWVDIDDPDPEYVDLDDPRGTFLQGYEKGGALFNRLEGCWEDDGSIFFVSTSGGDAKNGDVNPDGYLEGFGQVWEYRERHRGGVLTLRYESPSAEAMDSPDNLTVTPRGGLLMCEDDASAEHADTHPLAPGIENVNRLIGLTRHGEAFELAVNVLNGSEMAGCCFSPSGKTLFVNLYGSSSFSGEQPEGMTCAITGPWWHGPL